MRKRYGEDSTPLISSINMTGIRNRRQIASSAGCENRCGDRNNKHNRKIQPAAWVRSLVLPQSPCGLPCHYLRHKSWGWTSGKDTYSSGRLRALRQWGDIPGRLSRLTNGACTKRFWRDLTVVLDQVTGYTVVGFKRIDDMSTQTSSIGTTRDVLN